MDWLQKIQVLEKTESQAKQQATAESEGSIGRGSLLKLLISGGEVRKYDGSYKPTPPMEILRGYLRGDLKSLGDLMR